MRLLGVDFTSEAKTGEVWTSVKTGGLYRKALTDEMSEANVNFKEWANYSYDYQEPGGAVHKYVSKALYQLDMDDFNKQNVLAKAQDRFLKYLEEAKDLTETEREKAKRAAEKLVNDAIDARPLLKPEEE